ncbi:MAG: hypothetical protein Q9219_003754 [cf. Caloplaca sp. 3 TL-2023]
MSISTPPPTTKPNLPPPFTSTHPFPQLLTQGAEAHVYRTHFLTPSIPCILKYRPPKSYRHPILDARLTRHRILSEARTLVKCRREGVSVPGVLALGAEDGWMMVEWVGGGTVRERLQKRRDGARLGMIKEGSVTQDLRMLMGRIGAAVGRMHEVGIVHGDLTTSNLMLRDEAGEAENQEPAGTSQETDIEEVSLDGEIVLIDFGLAGQSIQDEDKAVDLYVLEKAFGSTHPEVEGEFEEVLRAYGESYKGAKVVLKRLEDVRLRGRKRSMVG